MFTYFVTMIFPKFSKPQKFRAIFWGTSSHARDLQVGLLDSQHNFRYFQNNWPGVPLLRDYCSRSDRVKITHIFKKKFEKIFFFSKMFLSLHFEIFSEVRIFDGYSILSQTHRQTDRQTDTHSHIHTQRNSSYITDRRS